MANSGNTSIKSRKVTFALHNPSQWQLAIDFCEDCPGFAYIKHDKDPDSAPHYHFYCEFDNPRYFSSISKKLGIAENMLEKVKFSEGLLFYLTHSDKKSKSLGKHEYSRDEIITNLPDSAFHAPIDKAVFWDLCADLVDRYYKGELSFHEVQSQLKLSFVDTMTPVTIFNFLLKLRSYAAPRSDDFSSVSDSYLSKNGTGGLSNGAMFHVPKPIQQTFFKNMNP